MSSDQRFPAAVYREGEEPDPRFSLANERTFLAWVRTALALYAGAFALEALAIPEPPVWRASAAGVFLVLGTIAALQAWWGWRQTERALRRGLPLPGLGVGGVIVLGVVVAAALVALGMWV